MWVRTQYEEHAARLLNNKKVMAYILIHSMEDFKGFSLEEAVNAIEGEIESGTRVEIGCDITFAARGKDGIKRVVYLTIFKSKEPHIFDSIAMSTVQSQCSMLTDGTISAMKDGRVNEVLMYRTIWILIDTPRKEDGKLRSDSVSHFVIETEKTENKDPEMIFWQREILKSSVICLQDNNSMNFENEMFEVLSELLFSKLPTTKKRKLLEEKYGIIMTNDMEEECSILHNFK